MRRVIVFAYTMRPLVIRLIAALLLTYGLTGIVASVLGARQAAALSSDAHAALASVRPADSSATARSIGRTLGSAASASSSGTQSLGRAQESLIAGAASATDLASAMSTLANEMRFEIFGSRPFGDVAQPLERSGQRLDELAMALTGTGHSLEANQRDFAALEQELRVLEQQSYWIADQIASAADSQAIAQTISSGEWLAHLVIAGFALQSLLFLAIGAALLLLTHPTRIISHAESSSRDAL
ncbi:MAG: hypothetical protein ACKVVP_05830 [Chloroflexota bacterium]